MIYASVAAVEFNFEGKISRGENHDENPLPLPICSADETVPLSSETATINHMIDQYNVCALYGVLGWSVGAVLVLITA